MTSLRDPRLPTHPPLIWTPYNDLETAITIQSAFSARDPNPSKDYGIGGVTFRFYVRGPLGAVDWDLSTGWYLPETHELHEQLGYDRSAPSGGAVTLHAATPRWDGHEPRSDCHTGINPCYGDVSYLAGDDVLGRLIKEGHDGVWAALGEWYFELPASPEQHEQEQP